MRVYLHLADIGLTLSDLALRIYDGESLMSVSGVMMETYGLSGMDYFLDNVPNPVSDGITLTFESPTGAYHAYRLGIADTQPLNVIIPIREVFIDPIDALSIRLFKDDVETTPDLDNISQLNSDGEYSVSGWTSTPIDQQWRLRWIYNGQVYVHSWIGTSISGVGTYYLEILSVQSPFDITPDSQGRSVWSVNFECTAKGPSNQFEREIATLLVEAGLGTRGIDIFLGRLSTLPDPNPDNDIPITQIINTGGSGPDETQNGDVYEHLTCQIVVRAIDYDIARTHIYAIWRELDGTRNVTVVAA